jgi:preprotein translocase subunit YajC
MNYLPAMLVASTTTTTTTSGSSGSSYYLLVLVVILVLVYFMWMRPNQRRRLQAARQARAFEVGDEVVAAGMVGRCVGMTDGEVDVEVADGVVVKFVNQAVQSRQAYAASVSRAGRGFGGGGFGAGSGGASGTGSLGGRTALGEGGPSSGGATIGSSGEGTDAAQGSETGDIWPDEGPADSTGSGKGGRG